MRCALDPATAPATFAALPPGEEAPRAGSGTNVHYSYSAIDDWAGAVPRRLRARTGRLLPQRRLRLTVKTTR